MKNPFEIDYNKLFHVKKNGDKIIHFIVGLILGMIFFHFFPALVTIILVSIIAISKEIYDKTHKKFFDLQDVIVTIIGGMTGYTLYIFFFM